MMARVSPSVIPAVAVVVCLLLATWKRNSEQVELLGLQPLQLEGVKAQTQQLTGVVYTHNLNYSDRISRAIEGFIIGVMLFVLSFPMLFMIEQIAVNYSVLIGRAQTACKANVSADRVDPRHEGRMIHVRGRTSVPKDHVDTYTGFSPVCEGKAVRLRRKVEMFQWVETIVRSDSYDKYIYTEEWREEDHRSNFRPGHQNPDRFPSLYTEIFDHLPVTVGAFTLTRDQVSKLQRWHAQKLDDGIVAGLTPVAKGDQTHQAHVRATPALQRAPTSQQSPTNLRDALSALESDFIYYGPPDTIGTVRMSFQVVEEGPVTIVGVQENNSFRAFDPEDAHIAQGKGPKGSMPGEQSRLLRAQSTKLQQSPSLMFRVAQVIPVPLRVSGQWHFPKLAEFITIKHAVFLLQESDETADDMFSYERSKSAKVIWLLRFAAFVLMSLGLYLMLKPVATVLSFLPFIPSLLGTLFFVVALLLGLVLTALTIAVAWISYRPEIIGFLLLGIGAAFFIDGHKTVIGSAEFSDHHIGLAFVIMSLVPLGAALYNLYGWWQYKRGIDKLDEEPPAADDARQAEYV
mmetsp:Transcript_17250/g.40606  ORF Transcript_17250/g.40606 Transcript_17250/m.40606 type:complete len:572 (+) Transcript_17250:73-1788(+)